MHFKLTQKQPIRSTIPYLMKWYSYSQDDEYPVYLKGKTPYICNPSCYMECPIYLNDKEIYDPDDKLFPK